MDKEILSRDRPGRESSPVTSPQGKTGNPKGEGRSPLGNKLNTEGKAKAALGARPRRRRPPAKRCALTRPSSNRRAMFP